MTTKTKFLAAAAVLALAIPVYSVLTAPGDLALQLAYLRGYFFQEHLGRGMPEVRGVQSSFTISAAIDDFDTAAQASFTAKLASLLGHGAALLDEAQLRQRPAQVADPPAGKRNQHENDAVF